MTLYVLLRFVQGKIAAFSILKGRFFMARDSPKIKNGGFRRLLRGDALRNDHDTAKTAAEF